MKRAIVVMAVLAATVGSGALAYQAAARERDYRAYLARGDAALRDEETFSAIEAYSGAAAIRPDSMLARLRRGETYQRRGELEAAARDFRRASALDPTATRPIEELGDVLYQMRRFAPAASAYERALALDDRSSRVAYKGALAQYRDGDLPRALASVRQALRLPEGSAETYYLLGIILEDLRRPAEARTALEKAVSLSPGFLAAREELADALARLGRHADEIAQLQVMAGLDRDRAARHVAVGLAQARRGRGDSAVLTLVNALERAPDQPLVYAAIGRVWLEDAEASDDRLALSKAIEALERAASTRPATSEVLTLYGRALLRDDQVDVAEQTLEAATNNFPVEPSAFLDYAVAAERRGHVERARQALVDYGALVTNDPELVDRAIHISSLSLQLNDPGTAITWLQRVAPSAPDDTSLLTLLAEAQLRIGDRDAARATIARGLELDADNTALLALARRIR